MILYLDPSAYVKQYFRETGSDAVSEVIAQARWVGSSIICRVEMEAAFAKYARMTFAVFDRQLWKAALAVGLDVFPDDIERWSP
ncbi:MAG: type II toxin-antitoxin system VapC family toxin [Chloroflexi bacterium]|nr:type II toxin-antitoxin system VapC family toxin [Chloroflexota bacterium]